MRHLLTLFTLAACSVASAVIAEEPSPPFRAMRQTGVTFETKDKDLQRLYDTAVARLAENIVRFTPSMKVLVEGGGYPNAWLETQPMGGEMMAKRDAQIALNNQLIFLLTQREDGRLPGMVISGETVRRNGWDRSPPEAHVWMPGLDLMADFEMFQGFCFPEPAWRMYHWMGRDKTYLKKLRDTLAAFDAYLWRTRDSNGDGLLETWCVWDTGEDESTRLTTRWAPNRWPFDKPPGAEGMPDPRDPAALRQYWQRGGPAPEPGQVRVPFQSMDIMAYSYSARATLTKISAELGDGRENEWQKAADEVRQRVIQHLWDTEKKACFDRDRDGKRLPELIHNNLRCMWYGIFTKEMADAFTDHHLLNPDEFWTPVPLPSIAINDPLFHNGLRNNWSGQPQGLTYQRAIDALENYGRFAEVTRLGEKLLPVLIRNGCRFPQQLDPMTGQPSGQKPDGYGPMILAALEYISRMHGIHLDVEHDRVWWSAVDPAASDFTSTQRWGDRHFRLSCTDGVFRGFVNDQLAFTCSAGTRVVTDLDGKVREVVGISPEKRKATLETGGTVHTLTVAPNEILRLAAAEKTSGNDRPPARSPTRPGETDSLGTIARFEVEQWAVFETSFTSGRKYDNPFTDVQVDVVFRSGDRQWLVPAFWAGGDQWKVRFAPPAQGDYLYHVKCSDPTNSQLIGASQTLHVTAYTGDNPLLRHGFLRVAKNQRHFEHADGTPFLWLADTWWKNLCKRMTWEGFQELSADRKAKGFNAIQIVCGPYPDESMMEARWENEGGKPYETKDFSVMNPAYFDFADRRIKHLVDAGMVPVIVGGWGRPQGGGQSTLAQVGLDGFKRHWRNLIARYGAYPTVWIVGGEAKDGYGPWSELARYVKETDPYHHPLTYHSPAHPRQAIKDHAVFEFDMIGIGHDGYKTAAQSLELMKSCLSQEPAKPALCGEACYEGHMQTNFQDVQRHLFWSFMLSGAAGHTYGAAGIWQASVEGDPGIDPIYDWTTWKEGMSYPGSTQLGIGKRLLEQYPWSRFEVHPEWAEKDCFAAGIPGEVRFIYQPKRHIYDWKGTIVKNIEPGVRYTAFYFDPATGRRFEQGPVGAPAGEYQAARLPSPQDWILVLERMK